MLKKINNVNIKKNIYILKNQKCHIDFLIFLKVMLNKIHQTITNNKIIIIIINNNNKKMLELYNFKLQLRKKHI